MDKQTRERIFDIFILRKEGRKDEMLAPVVLWGIAAGATVFVATIVAVFFLLQHGGSFDRMKQEAAGMPTSLGELKPLLYDELLEKARAMATAPAPLGSATPLRGEFVCIRDFEGDQEDIDALFRISNGEPQCVLLPVPRQSPICWEE